MPAILGTAARSGAKWALSPVGRLPHVILREARDSMYRQQRHLYRSGGGKSVEWVGKRWKSSACFSDSESVSSSGAPKDSSGPMKPDAIPTSDTRSTVQPASSSKSDLSSSAPSSAVWSNAVAPARQRGDESIPTATNVPPMPISPSLPFHQRLGPITVLLNAYGNAQRRRPYWTQFFSALAIYLCGDLSAQAIEGHDNKDSWLGRDWARTARNLLIGGMISIPAYHWFIFLSKNFNYSSIGLSLLTKVIVNQLCFTPVFNSYYFGTSCLLSGGSIIDVWERIKTTVPVSYANSWKLWPWVTAFNFYYVPMQMRAVFAGVVAIGWQSYLSWLNRRAELRITEQEKGLVE